jgi:hypothetical protein
MAHRPRSKIAEDICCELRCGNGARPQIEKQLADLKAGWEEAQKRAPPSAATLRKVARKRIAAIEAFPLPGEQVLLVHYKRAVAAGGIVGAPPNFSAIGEFCARVAYGLVKQYSTKKASARYADSPFRVIAGLICEAITGEPDRDFERSCKAVIRNP